jgi:hypothetical protein
LAICPGVEAVSEGKLSPRKLVDHGVESGRQAVVEVAVVLLVGVSDEVEVPDHEPGAGDGLDEQEDLGHEGSGEGVIGWGVNVCERERQIRGGGGEGGG